jgi:Uma2 family endonuclease
VTASSPRPATYEDVLAAPEDVVAEVVDGELHLQPRPRRRHLRTASTLGAFLVNAFDSGTSGPGGWILIDEPELHLGARPDIVVPDIAGWREERYPGDVDDDAPFFTERPDWLCEVLSESTARWDRMKKMPVYAREGVPHVWLVDPRDRTIVVYRLEGDHYALLGTWGGEDEAVRLEPFEAVEIPPAALWGRRVAPP